MIKAIFLFFSLAVVHYPWVGSSNQQDGSERLMEIIRQTVLGADTVDLTGDPDFDFVSLMKTHYTGGIAIADMEIENGNNQGLINLATNAKEEQVTQLNKIIRIHCCPVNIIISEITDFYMNIDIFFHHIQK